MYALDMIAWYTDSTRIRKCTMQKKLSVITDEEVYESLYQITGPVFAKSIPRARSTRA
ncbi:MAG TPA: hypothetical protein PLG17_08860 [Thermodesulfobacteriota bacterium]|nr:hypothetical protein [Deltaproteobacteria bacterium]HNR14501.1 hypothetical protein [Thermodesulfobacteriota bacterium]HOC38575.1 hypothetical protein [Thermodesulfobacteriota bacterium]HQO78608.1 hypothetical protein [Thermodesulfobacteriota bacterium]